MIKNKPRALLHHGADVAGPVFKEIADRLYGTYIRQPNTHTASQVKKDSNIYSYPGNKRDIIYVNAALNMRYTDSSTRIDEWVDMNRKNAVTVLKRKNVDRNSMPQLKGMGLKDVVYLCENMGLKLTVKGRGKVAGQSIQPGQPVAKGQLVNIELN